MSNIPAVVYEIKSHDLTTVEFTSDFGIAQAAWNACQANVKSFHRINTRTGAKTCVNRFVRFGSK
jgi:hypothetical protein